MFYSKGTDYEPLIASGGMRSFKVEKLDDMVYKQGTKAYPYNKTFEEAVRDPIVIVHTLGSTGMPKPILWNHGISFSSGCSLVVVMMSMEADGH